jgi:hypothetical protein
MLHDPLWLQQAALVLLILIGGLAAVFALLAWLADHAYPRLAAFGLAFAFALSVWLANHLARHFNL